MGKVGEFQHTECRRNVGKQTCKKSGPVIQEVAILEIMATVRVNIESNGNRRIDTHGIGINPLKAEVV